MVFFRLFSNTRCELALRISVTGETSRPYRRFSVSSTLLIFAGYGLVITKPCLKLLQSSPSNSVFVGEAFVTQDDSRLLYSAFEANGAGLLGSARSGAQGIDVWLLSSNE
jgi:hypothetical protein